MMEFLGYEIDKFDERDYYFMENGELAGRVTYDIDRCKLGFWNASGSNGGVNLVETQKLNSNPGELTWLFAFSYLVDSILS